MTGQLPHDPYISTVATALADAGLTVGDTWTSDDSSHGMYSNLEAVFTIGTPAAGWEHGLLLVWEWHTGMDTEPHGPVWSFAELKGDGSNEYPTQLPVYGYASPAAVVDATLKVIDREIGRGSLHNLGQPKWDGGIIGDTWDDTDALDAACNRWTAINYPDADR